MPLKYADVEESGISFDDGAIRLMEHVAAVRNRV